jgi:hypothetical protein
MNLLCAAINCYIRTLLAQPIHGCISCVLVEGLRLVVTGFRGSYISMGVLKKLGSAHPWWLGKLMPSMGW